MGSCVKVGWNCGFFVGDRIRGEMGNDMDVWEWSNQRCNIIIPFVIGKCDYRDIIWVSGRS
jgi:hypothetical protein